MRALRELLERALFTNDKLLFGAQTEAIISYNGGEKLLLDQNRKNVCFF